MPMKNFEIYFPEINYCFPMIFVEGTGNGMYRFGVTEKKDIRMNDFFISQYLVTQRLWEYITGNNPAHFVGQHRPVEVVSFNDVTQPNGFLDQFNAAAGQKYKLNDRMLFRLPSETEWEYAARGGKYWKDDFQFSGSNDIDQVAWYHGNSGKYTDLEVLARLRNHEKGTSTRDVGQKLPNQLGIFDMNGNVWEWCQDTYQPDLNKIPADGLPYSEPGNERVLRGGCHHNGAIHSTVSKRYNITPDAKDECIGFRIAASIL
jgi:formylglycine-generating enzyme